MRTTTSVHLTEAARVSIDIRTGINGERYLVLNISDNEPSYLPGLALFIRGPEFLDKLANEAERAVREFVGDVPEPLHMTGQFCECAECAPAEVVR